MEFISRFISQAVSSWPHTGKARLRAQFSAIDGDKVALGQVLL